jgi:hypothetical protein
MTKKAMNLKDKHFNRINNHLSFYENTKHDFDWTRDYLNTIHNDFDNMVGSMYIYGLLSEKDYDELHAVAFGMYQEAIERLYRAY